MERARTCATGSSTTTPAPCIDALERGTPGETYNVGGHNEKSNLDVVRAICDLLDARRPDHTRHFSLV